MATRHDLKGHRFHRLLVLEYDGTNHSGRVRWLCLCDCGTRTSVLANNLKRNYTRSCGCFNQEIRAQKKLTHGHSRRTNRRATSEYAIWASMLSRCRNPNNKRFKDYGGRGIRVCKRWLSFVNFLADMGPRPPRLTLERSNNNLGYTPSNCRWATYREQRLNQRPRKQNVAPSFS